ncbi:hypothetical protein XENOCAPTIV_019738, partial [Xenoophorus captivus]
FIIELCEPIQLKQLDIANFELFSSTPKDFLVSISDRVFGTSMVEEYEEIADPSERADDQDDDLGRIVPYPQMHWELPDARDVQSLPDSVVPPTETAAPDTSPTNYEEKLLPVEEKIVIPLEKDEEEPISSTITLLDKEEELEDDKDKQDNQQWHDESLKYCAPCSSSCSCVASFQEFIQHKCSASLSNKRTCQTVDKVQKSPSMLTPSWPLPPPSSAYPQLHPHDSKADQSNEKEPASEQQPDSGTMDAEAVPPSGNTDAVRDPQVTECEPNILEPSQTLNTPNPTATESSSAKPTPVVETPELSSEEPMHESGPEKSQDVLTEEKLVEPSLYLSSSVEMKPSVSVSADDASAALTREKPNIDPSQAETNASFQTQDVVDPAPVLSSTSSENQVEPHAELEISPTSSEVPPTAADIATEPEPTGRSVPETNTEDLAEEFSVSSGGHDQMFHPSIPTSASPTSTSLVDIYAEPFNGTEQNGNQVHGSSQKESVFMRLNNRIKALEVNMSLSGRYLEQLSQR